MEEIFSRRSVRDIVGDESLTPDERADRLISLYGRAIGEGYVAKDKADAAQRAALNRAQAEWEKAAPDPRESDEYKALRGEYDAYRAMQNARLSGDYRSVKPKFFETVYGMIDRGDGAKSVREQLSDIRGNYEEYFEAEPDRKPQFGAQTQGAMPRGSESAEAALTRAWGFVPGKE